MSTQQLQKAGGKVAKAENALSYVIIGLSILEKVLQTGEAVPMFGGVCKVAGSILEDLKEVAKLLEDALAAAQLIVDVLALLEMLKTMCERLRDNKQGVKDVESRLSNLERELGDYKEIICGLSQRGRLAKVWKMFRNGVKLSSIDNKIRAQLDMLLNFYRVTMDEYQMAMGETLVRMFEKQLAEGRQRAHYVLEEAVEAEAQTYLKQHPNESTETAIDEVMQDEAVLERLAPRLMLQGDEMRADIKEEIRASIVEVHNNVKKLTEQFREEMRSIGNKVDAIKEQVGEQGFTYDPQNKQKALLGEGIFGEVYRMRDNLGKRRAVKMIRVGRLGLTAMQILKEAEILAELDHPHIVRYYQICGFDDGRKVAIVMELLVHSLTCEMLKAPNEHKIATWVRQIASGLAHMHSHKPKVLHGDLKPDNVMFDAAKRARLIDFGLATVLEAKSRVSSRPAGSSSGTAMYMSPQKADGSSYDDKDDVWALGCILLGCLLGAPLEKRKDVHKHGFLALNKEKIQELINESKAKFAYLSDLVKQMLNDEPLQRPTASAVEVQLSNFLNSTPEERALRNKQSLDKDEGTLSGRPATSQERSLSNKSLESLDEDKAAVARARELATPREIVEALTASGGSASIATAALARLVELTRRCGSEQAAVDAGALAAVVAAMRAHPSVSGVQESGCAAIRNICAGTDAAGDARKQAAVDAGAIDAVVAAMRAHPSVSGVQEVGCRAICRICSGTDDEARRNRAQAAVDAGAIAAVVAAMRAHLSASGVQEDGCRAIGNICAGTADDEARRNRAQAAVDAGALDAVVAAMRAHLSASGVQEDGCGAIRNICAGTADEARRNRAQAAVDAGAIDAVVAAMRAHLSASAVQEDGCGTIGNICWGTDAAGLARAQAAVDAGAIDAVVAAMRAHLSASAVQEDGCGAIRNICAGTADDEARRNRAQAAVDAGAIDAVVAAMRAHPDASGVQEDGCAAINNICAGTDAAGLARKQAAVDAGAIDAVVAAMRAHPVASEVQEDGCVAIGRICAGTDDEARRNRAQAAVDAGALDAVVAAMRAHPDASGVQEDGCAAINNICAGTDAAGLARAQAAVDAGAIDAVVAAMRAHLSASEVQEDGCGAIGRICAGTDDEARRNRAQAAVDAGALDAVVAAMRAHPDASGVQEDGCAAINNICAGTDAAGLARKQAAVDAGAIDAVVAAMRAHPVASEVQEYGCWAIRNICFGTDSARDARAQAAVDAGAIAAVVAGMRAHPSESGVQEYGCRAINNINNRSTGAGR